MPEVEDESVQFVVFSQEEKYYDLRFEYVSPLYISALHNGWTLSLPRTGAYQDTDITNNQSSTSVSEACETFCDSLGLRSVLVNCLEKINEAFSNLVNLSAELDHFRDDQAENAPHVVIRVEVHSDQKTVLREYDQLVCWMSAEIPPSESHHFTITVRRV